jgi:hypothetical protein
MLVFRRSWELLLLETWVFELASSVHKYQQLTKPSKIYLGAQGYGQDSTVCFYR